MSDVIDVPITFIRSFKYRSTFYLNLPKVSRSSTVAELFDTALNALQKDSSAPPPFKTFTYDGFKIRHKAYGSKSGDLLIEMKTEPIRRSNQTLKSLGIQNESEVAMFNLADYESFLKDPEFAW
ncbi:unnamed protein product [Calicophoron daubneyi]|uniref:Uncharacterized protein n=1 Tax=Calicophoron daubneyi TaxID=300641 RepID=A0AAV2TQ58_CALDB